MAAEAACGSGVDLFGLKNRGQISIFDMNHLQPELTNGALYGASFISGPRAESRGTRASKPGFSEGKKVIVLTPSGSQMLAFMYDSRVEFVTRSTRRPAQSVAVPYDHCVPGSKTSG